MAKKAKQAVAKTSVKSYNEGINLEKQKMGTYAKKMGTNVKSLQGEFKKHSKEIKEAGKNMLADGNKKMSAKIEKFNGEIKNQIRENKESIANMGNGVKLFISDVNKKKKDFQAYSRGPFNGYIKAFWG